MHVCMHGHCMHSCIEFLLSSQLFCWIPLFIRYQRTCLHLKCSFLFVCAHTLACWLMIWLFWKWWLGMMMWVLYILKVVFDEIDDIVVMYEGFCLNFKLFALCWVWKLFAQSGLNISWLLCYFVLSLTFHEFAQLRMIDEKEFALGGQFV